MKNLKWLSLLLCLTLLIFKFYIVLQCTKKLGKLPKLENFRAVHNWGADGKILETARAGAISQSDYRTTEILAEKSEICITSLPNFMVQRKSLGFFAFFVHIDVRKYRKKKLRVRWAFLSMCRLLNKLASSVRIQL